MTPLEFLLKYENETPNAVAIKMNGKELSYSDFAKIVRSTAPKLKEQGVKGGDKVALYTDSDLEHTIMLFSLWSLGAVAMPMNITQIDIKLKQIESVVVPDIGFNSLTYKMTFSRDFPIKEITDDFFLEELSHEEIKLPKDDDLAVIMFTSGTSGTPKAVPMTHEGIALNSFLTAKRINMTSEDCIFINTPPYFTSAIIHVLTMMSVGASIAVDRGFLFGSGIMDMIKKYDCTGFGGVPVHFSRLLASAKDEASPKRLRFLMNSGDHLPVATIKSVKEILDGVQIYCVYGLTEVAGRLCILDPSYIESKEGSVGLPLKSMTVTVRGDNGEELTARKSGEVFVDGPLLMSGYLNAPEINEAAMTTYGFATGDYGYKDEDGFLFLKGRNDDIFKVGGEKVSVKEIEEHIKKFEDFEEFVVAKVHDDHMGNIPCLFYVLKDGVNFDRKKLVKFLKINLPPAQIPPRFIEVSEIPRTASGKAIRSELTKDSN